METWWRTPEGVEPGAAGLGLTDDAEPAILPEDVERIRTAMRITVATDAPYDIEYRRVEPDGRVRWIHSVGRAVRGAEGRALRLAGVARDVTDRRSVQAALQEAKDRLETLVSASPLPIITRATDGNITRWNAAAERVFGWTEQEVLGKPLPFIPEERIEEYRALRAREQRGENLTSLESGGDVRTGRESTFRSPLRRSGMPREKSLPSSPSTWTLRRKEESSANWRIPERD